MLKQFYLDIKNNKSDLALPVWVLSLCFLFGFGVLCAIMFNVDDPGAWFPVGTIVAMFCLLLLAVITFAKYHMEFMLALSMGRTRSDFMGSYALRSVLMMAIGYGVLLLLYWLELTIGKKLFAEWPLGAEFDFLFDWRIVVGALVGSVVLPMFLGALYSRFGKKFLVPLWFAWMGLCILGPQFLDEESAIYNASITVALRSALSKVPEWGWYSIVAAAVVGMGAGIYALGKKQMVR